MLHTVVIVCHWLSSLLGIIILFRGNVSIYRGADKSVARPNWKNNWKVGIFCPTRRSLLLRVPGWTDNLLNFFWVACKS